MTTATNLLDLALALPPSERVMIAEALLESLVPVDPEADRLILEECRRRWASFQAGDTEAIPWEEALAELDRDLETA
jgi:putative addiction module component (TIGR02574 family)